MQTLPVRLTRDAVSESAMADQDAILGTDSCKRYLFFTDRFADQTRAGRAVLPGRKRVVYDICALRNLPL